MKKPNALLILDGFGVAPQGPDNAIAVAKTPVFDRLWAKAPHTTLSAAGLDVGLPAGQMGNSEVGHTNIGAGRVVYQDLPRISKDIEEGGFFQNPAFLAAVENCKRNNAALHLLGLLSDGGVHSHNTHLYAFLELAHRHGLPKVFVHAFLDGRDVPPRSGRDYVAQADEKCRSYGYAMATVMGRYYAMDRDNRWERVSKAYEAMVYGDGAQNRDPVAAVEASYQADVSDEFVLPVVCDSEGTIKANDSIIFFNFRPDRAREITRAFVDPDFSGFERRAFFPLCYVCTTQYDAAMPNVLVAYGSEDLADTLGSVLSERGLTQLRIAETEKYAHVTFFFNGGVEQVFPGEERALIPSPKVATYDLKPEMSAPEVTEEVIRRIESGQYDVIILNFANCDMVGHTGIFDAAVQAVETVDACTGKILDSIAKMGGQALITADHGNSDKMLEEDGITPFTAHTTNPVPLFYVGPRAVSLKADGRLCDIAPTLLDLMDIPRPAAMTGHSLVE